MNLLKKWVLVFLMTFISLIGSSQNEKYDKFRPDDDTKHHKIDSISDESCKNPLTIIEGLELNENSFLHDTKKDSLRKIIIDRAIFLSNPDDYRYSIFNPLLREKEIDIHTESFCFIKRLNIEKYNFGKIFHYVNNSNKGVFIIDHCIFHRNITLEWNEFYGEFEINNSDIMRFEFNENNFLKTVSILNNSFRNFEMNNNTFSSHLRFENCSFNKIDPLGKNYLKGDLEFINCSFNDVLPLLNSEVSGTIRFYNCKLPPTKLALKKLQQNRNTKIIFSNCTNVADSTKRIIIDLTDCDLKNLYLDYNNFEVDFSNLQKNKREEIYLSLLHNFESNGQRDNYELLDLEYKNQFDDTFKYFIQKFWWNYGYSRHYIFYNTGTFLIVFTFLTMLFYKKLQSAYAIENADTNYGRFANSFIYTNIVFWALRVDITRMKFRDHLAAASYVMLMYVTGIICLAYMVNYVIQS